MHDWHFPQEINGSDKKAISEFLNLNEEEAGSLLNIAADTIKTIKTIDLQSLTTIEVKLKFNEKLNLAGFTKNLCNYIDSNIYEVFHLSRAIFLSSCSSAIVASILF